MKLSFVAVVAAVAFCAPVLAHAESETAGVSLSSTKLESRKASLLDGQKLDSGGVISENTAFALLDLLRFDRQGLPPLDTGGAVSSDSRAILALVIGLIFGLGLGHLIAGDKNGFILFLIVDLAIIVVSSILIWAAGWWWFGILEAVGLIASHIFQGIDAYGQASGRRLVEATRQRAVMVADTGSHSMGPPPITTRLLSFSF